MTEKEEKKREIKVSRLKIYESAKKLAEPIGVTLTLTGTVTAGIVGLVGVASIFSLLQGGPTPEQAEVLRGMLKSSVRLGAFATSPLAFLRLCAFCIGEEYKEPIETIKTESQKIKKLR